MMEFISINMNHLGISHGKYSVIHIRSGDKYLSQTESNFDINYYLKLCDEINIYIKQPFLCEHILFICDNNQIKFLLHQHFPQIKFLFKQITHLGEKAHLDKDNTQNTMLDFYLLAMSNSIYCLSSYEHGSGFSLWCAITYNIPYKCKFIKNTTTML